MFSHIQQYYYLNLPESAGTFSVLNFTVHEALGRPWRAEVWATTEGPEPKRSALLHKEASFVIERAMPPLRREWKGILRLVGVRRHSTDETLFRVIIEPRLARLCDSTHCRLFQNKSVPEIVADMLRHHNLSGNDFQFKLTRE